MGRAPCCDKANVKKGPWSPEEDATLKAYIEEHGTGGNWIALPQKIGLKRCGKSCRLRWLNYLRPNIKHGGFSEEEDNIICNLYISIGSRWSIIAAQLPGRTDNDIKNYWNTRLKKKLLGRRKQSGANRGGGGGGGQDLKDADQALSSSAIERLQLHMQLQSLQNPFSFYNNPALWPKLHPFQQKMTQQAAAMNDQTSSSLMMMQQQQQFAVLPGHEQTTGGALAIPEQYARLCINPNMHMDDEFLSATGNINPVDSTIVVAKTTDIVERQVNSSCLQQQQQAQLDVVDGVNNSTVVGFMTPQQQQQDADQMAAAEFDCFNVNKDSIMWWANDFDNKSASSNSWDSTTSVLHSQGMFQDYELGYNL